MYILKYSDPIREKWDYLVMTLSIYNGLWLPYEQAFEENDHCNFSNLQTIDIINYVIDTLFAVDIILNFNTTIQDQRTGMEIRDRKSIIYNYLTGLFIVDLFATVPIYEIFCVIFKENSSMYLQLLPALKLVRIFRLQRVIGYMNTTDDVKLIMNLLKTSIFLVISVHFNACLWFALAK